MTFRWGILGVAKHARGFVIPAIQKAAGNEVAAIASRDADRAAAAAAEMDIPKSYGGYEDMLADPDIDAVYNPLPNHLHVPMSIEAMEAGKHVLCEKPIGLSRDQATKLVSCMERTGKRTMEAFMYKHHPQWDLARSLIADGRIGKVRMTQAWFSYFQKDDGNIRWLPKGGGALYDIGCYTINSARMIFGEEPNNVSCRLKTRRDVDVVASAILEFTAGHATFTVSVEQAESQGIHIAGTEGELFIERPFNPWIGRAALIRVTNGTEVEEISLPEADHFQVEVERFSEAITTDSAFVVTLEDSLANMDVIDRLFAAAG